MLANAVASATGFETGWKSQRYRPEMGGGHNGRRDGVTPPRTSRGGTQPMMKPVVPPLDRRSPIDQLSAVPDPFDRQRPRTSQSFEAFNSRSDAPSDPDHEDIPTCAKDSTTDRLPADMDAAARIGGPESPPACSLIFCLDKRSARRWQRSYIVYRAPVLFLVIS
jgi:hypothetical protein